MSSILIKNGEIIDFENFVFKKSDILIEENKIVKISESIDLSADKIIDAKNNTIIPGIIDLGVRFREPGLEQEATIRSESKAAASSGVTTVAYLPDTNPIIDTAGQVKFVQDLFSNVKLCKVKVISAATKNLNGEQITSMMSLKSAGAIGVDNTNNKYKNTLIMRRVMEYASGCELTFFYHPLDYDLSNNGCYHEGSISAKLGLPGIPAAAESIAVTQAIELSKLTNSKLHICRVSCKDSLDIIHHYISKGYNVSYDIAVNQLFFSENSISEYDTNFHVIPPYRSENDMLALINDISSSDNLSLCSDHQPHNNDAKQKPFPESKSGVSCIEILFPLIMSLVDSGKINAFDAIKKITLNPANVIGFDNYGLKEGSTADIAIFEKEKWIYTRENTISAGKNIPFNNFEFSHKIKYTICDGDIVYTD